MMTKQEPSYHSLLLPKGQALIAVPRRIGGLDFIEYFPTEDDRQAAERDEVGNKALAAAGAWGDADADAFFEELERARDDASPAPCVPLSDPDQPNEVSIESRGQSRS
jgi:hypothetical protein